MARSSDRDNGTYTATGWRITGRDSERIAERAAAYGIERLQAGNVSDTLYAVQCTTPPVVRGRATVERVLDAITDEIRQTWADSPRLVRDEAAERPPSRFSGLRYEVMAEPGREWLGEIVWRAVHPVVMGAPITTRVLVEERGSFTRLNTRVTADDGLRSVRGWVGAGQVQPAFLRALRTIVTPTWMGGPLAAHDIREGAVDDFVTSVLEAESRNLPVAVLSPTEDGEFIVDPEDLAWDLLGRARLHVIRDHKLTFALSDAVGDRRMSCYRGAVRCYMPGWSRHDDPLDHPLLVADRLADPMMRAVWLGELGVWLGSRLELPASIEDRRIEAAAAVLQAPAPHADPGEARNAAGPGRAATAQRPGTGSASSASDPAREASPSERSVPDVMPPPTSPDFTPLFDRLIDEVRNLGSAVSNLTDEVERLRTISAVRSSSTSAIERRLGRLEDILDRAFPDGSLATASTPGDTAVSRSAADEPIDDDDGRPTLVEVVQDAAESHSDALVFLNAAHASATASPYEDPERVRAILEAMARVARRRRDGALGTSLRDAFGDLGIDYRVAIARSTPARLREQYRFTGVEGELVEAEEHIVLGNTYDPRRCLRIYFSSRVPNEPRFVIGHVGRHFEVRSTT